MNTQRLLILGLAGFAAIVVALLVRGLMGGGTPKSVAAVSPPVQTAEVLVAATQLQPGQHVDASQVRWMSWPRRSLDSSFITQDGAPNALAAVNGTVVRAPMVPGEPVTNNKIVHTDAAGIMAATLTPGMRALSIGVTTDTGAGGFILPNDRVDLLTTLQVSEQPKRYRSRVLFENLRVLAMDQTYKEDKDQKVVLAKTATLEVTDQQAQRIMQAEVSGLLSLALRSLSDSSTPQSPAQQSPAPFVSTNPAPAPAASTQAASNEAMAIVRYGVSMGGSDARGE